MKDKHSSSGSNFKGNILLTFFSVFIGIAVTATAIYLWNRTDGAIPQVKDFINTVAKPVNFSFNISPDNTSSNNSSSKVSSSSKEQTSSAESSSAASPSSSAVKTASAAKDLENALFIGDSYTDGLTLYCGIPKTRTFCSNNMTTGSILKKKYSFREKTVSVTDAALDLSPKGIFIMLGANDVSQGFSADTFKENYSELVGKLKGTCPNANIYIQSVIPVSENYSAKNKSGLNNIRIKNYNEALKTLSSEKGCEFLDIGGALSNGTGILPSKSTGDGYHLKSLAYSDWLTFLQNEK